MRTVRAHKGKHVAARLFSFVFLTALAFAAAFPLLYTFSNSFMGAREFARNYGGLNRFAGSAPLHLIPDMVTLEAYFKIFIERPHYLLKFWISLGIGGAILAGQLAVSILGGYAFSKFRFPGRDVLFFVIIVIMMMPSQVTLVPNYIMLERLGWLSQYRAIIVPGMFSAFGVFLLRQFMMAVPNDFIEAAKIEGAGEFHCLFMVLANCKSGVASLVVLSFIDSWNMVEQPLAFLKEPYKQPMSVFLTNIAEAEPSLGFACGMLAILPALYLFFFFREDLAGGISYSVIK